jgi:multidrug efflux system membrane fusion protein
MPVIATLLLLTLALLSMPACNSTQAVATTAPPPPAAPVKVAQAEGRTVPVEIIGIGNVEASSTILVKAQVGGTIVKANFTEGDMVRQGQTLIEIYAKPFEEAVRQWEANLARDRALLAQAEANLARAKAQEAHYGKQAERYEKLAAEGIFSREQADQAAVEARARRTSVLAESAARDSALASIQADEAALSNAKLNLGYCTIKSPINGRTGALLVKPGNLIKANDIDIVSIHQIQPVDVRFSVPEVHLLELRRRSGLVVQAAIPGDSRPPVQGSISFLDNAVDMSTGTIRLKGTFPNADMRLWPGQFVDVRLRLGERPNSVIVPASAVQNGQNGNFAYVVKTDGTAELRAIKMGARIDNAAVVIEEGLQPGETVVIEGHLRLAPGMKVRVIS